MTDPPLTLNEAAARLGISRRTATRYVLDGRLRASKPRPGGKWIIYQSWLDEYIAAGTPEHVSA